MSRPLPPFGIALRGWDTHSRILYLEERLREACADRDSARQENALLLKLLAEKLEELDGYEDWLDEVRFYDSDL